MSQDIINNRFLEESVFAIADGYCVINLTKSIVRGSMYQVVNGKKYNLNEQLGLPENSSLQSLVDAWALTIPEEGLKDFLDKEGYNATIAFNAETAMYRVIVNTFADRASAAQARDAFKAKYPSRKDFQGAWLLYRIY